MTYCDCVHYYAGEISTLLLSFKKKNLKIQVYVYREVASRFKNLERMLQRVLCIIKIPKRFTPTRIKGKITTVFIVNFKVFFTTHRKIQCVPLATEPGTSLIILPLMRILQRNLKLNYFIV